MWNIHCIPKVSHYSQIILLYSFIWVTNKANPFIFQILFTIKVIIQCPLKIYDNKNLLKVGHLILTNMTLDENTLQAI